MLHYDNPFWRFSCSLYGEPEIAHQCLQLQQLFGLNVNLLLLCCWLGRQGRALPEDWQRILAPALRWDREHVQPLRRQRQQLKELAGNDEHLQRQRELIKQAELLAEQYEQALLYEALEALEAEATATEDLTACNLQRYAESATGQDLDERLQPLLQACQQAVDSQA